MCCFKGSLDLMKNNLEPIFHVVLGALTDPEQKVCGTATFTPSQLAEHPQPEIISHHESVLPCILNALEDIFVEVKENSYYVLATICENICEEILPLLDPLLGNLLTSLF